MGTLEEIKKMQQEGRSDEEIAYVLASKGIPQPEIQNYIAQSKIKEAVESPSARGIPNPPMVRPSQQSMQEMVPSMIDSGKSQQQYTPQESTQDYGKQYQTTGYDSQQYSAQNQQYQQQASAQNQQFQQQDPNYSSPQYGQQYEPAQYEDPAYASQDYGSGSISSDTINEIAEQIVTEKISQIRNKIEESISSKNIIETKIEYLDERIKRIEKVIDRLQLSVLQKVGDYMTNVEDIKQELIETQKSFKALQSQKANFKN